MRVITDCDEYNNLMSGDCFEASSLLFEWTEKTTIPARTLNLTATFKSLVTSKLLLTVKFFGLCGLDLNRMPPFTLEAPRAFLTIEPIASHQMERINYRTLDTEDHGEALEFLFDDFFAVVED